MRVGLSLLLTFCFFTQSSLAAPPIPGPDAPLVIIKNRGVSTGWCVGAVVVAGALGLLGGHHWRGEQRSEFLNGALRPLVSADATLDELNSVNHTLVLSAERYFIEAEGITHSSGAVLPHSKDTVAIGAINNVIIRQDGSGFLYGFNPVTQEWIALLNKPVKVFRTSLRNLAAIDTEGNLHHFHAADESKFRFRLEAGELSWDFHGLEHFDRGKFDSLIVLGAETILAVDLSDAEHRRVYIMNGDGHNILQQENRGANQGLEHFLRNFEKQQRRQHGEAPEA